MRYPRKLLRRLGTSRVSRPGGMAREMPRPPACPAGWSVGPPDFVGVGAQKAGTTWWFHLIASHPDVYHDPNQPPELHYWDHFSNRWPGDQDFDAYRRLFPRPPGKKTGEKTPAYMFDYWVAPMLKLAAPEARIIVLLRDPIERYRSAAAMGGRKGWVRDRFTETSIFNQGLYGSQLARLYDVFPREQVLVLQYERCTREPLEQLAHTYEFMGLAPHTPAIDEIERKRNVTRETKAPLDPKRLETLVDAYTPDVRVTRELVPDLDPSLWKHFARVD
jgi:hypothetical protein